MRKTWQRFFLICVACMICMQGLCLAKKNADWVEFHRESGMIVFLANTDFVKVREWSGRKYLEATILHKMEGGRAEVKYVVVIDVDNHKAIQLEAGQQDISEIANADKMNVRGEKLLRWIEQNRPDVINEIRTHNLTAPPLPSAPQPAPGANTGATGAPKVPSGSLEAIVGDIDYEVLDSGAVKFNVRCPNPDPWTWGFNNTFYICAKPEKFKAYPGKYVVGVMSEDDGVIVIFMAGGGAFDYDPKTQAFTFYVWDTNNSPETSEYEFRMRVIDKNTVHLERFYPVSYIKDGPPEVDYSDWTGTFKYIPCDAIPYKIIAVDGPWVTVDTVKYQLQNFRINPDRCLWFGGPTPWGASNNDSWFGAEVDMARAFFAVNGNIGEAPCDVEYFPRN